MESVKLSVQTDHKFLTRASIFWRARHQRENPYSILKAKRHLQCSTYALTSPPARCVTSRLVWRQREVIFRLTRSTAHGNRTWLFIHEEKKHFSNMLFGRFSLCPQKNSCCSIKIVRKTKGLRMNSRIRGTFLCNFTISSAGTYQPNDAGAGLSSCYACPSGSYCPAGSESPTPCAEGHYSSGPGATECAACPPGAYAGGTGSFTCTPCEPGTHQPNYGSTACDSCPEQWTSGEGFPECNITVEGWRNFALLLHVVSFKMFAECKSFHTLLLLVYFSPWQTTHGQLRRTILHQSEQSWWSPHEHSKAELGLSVALHSHRRMQRDQCASDLRPSSSMLRPDKQHCGYEHRYQLDSVLEE